jgi:hypothetical protein
MKTAGPSSRGGNSGTRVGCVEVHIEELVLHGFGAGDRLQIRDALEQELMRLLAEQGGWNLPNGQLEIERLNGGTFRVAPSGRPEGVGAEVARAIHGTFGSTNRHEFGQRTQNRVAAVGRNPTT